MDKDTRILFGASEGWGSFRRFPELTPLYGNNFDRHEISVGKEWNVYTPFIPFVPAYAARATPLVDLVYDYAGTGAAGLGSQRYALSARAGLSFRFGSMDDGEAIVRLRVGAGAAYNILNFGKGIVPSGDFGLNVAAQASASFVYCLNQLLCVGPKVAVGGDSSANYSTFYGTLGVEINGKVGPQSRLVVDKGETPPDEPAPAKPQAAPPVSPPLKQPDVPPVSPPVKQPVVAPVSPPVTPPVAPQGTSTPPPGDCEQLRKPLVEQVNQCQKQLKEEKKICPDLKEKIRNCEASIPEIIDKIKWVESVRYLMVVKPQQFVLFQNDSTELELLEQKFPSKSVKYWGKGHPILDAVIRRVHDWENAIQRSGASQSYTISITVRGFANETGGTSRNIVLANARARKVVAYLTQSNNTRDYKGKKVAPLELGGPLKSIAAIQYSDSPGNIVDPKAEIRKVLLAGRDPGKLDETQKAAMELDVQNPVWRMALIEYRIIGPDGKEISVDDFTRKIGLEGGKY